MLRSLLPPRLRRPACARPVRWLLAALLVAATALNGQAQDLQGRIGAGVQVGNPSGLTVKLYKPTGLPLDALFATRAIEFLVEWDLDRAYLLQTSIVNEQTIELSPLRYFVGPGVVVGVRREGQAARFTAGLLGNVGVNFFLEHFEVFLHLTPQLDLVPRTSGFLGGGIGMRYFF